MLSEPIWMKWIKAKRHQTKDPTSKRSENAIITTERRNDFRWSGRQKAHVQRWIAIDACDRYAKFNHRQHILSML